MHRRRPFVRVSLLLVALLLASAWLASALPLPAAAASADDPHTVAVFIEGYASSYDPAGAARDGFATVRVHLFDDGWQPDQVARFSYAGGKMDGPFWLANPYACQATTEGIAAGADTLAEFLNDYLAARPDSNFVLVGHSLGGVLAWWNLNRARLDADLHVVVAVISIDSPLEGIGRAKSFALDYFGGCRVAENQTLDDLIALESDNGEWIDHWREVGEWAGERGVRVLSVGNQNDCFYWFANRNCAPTLPLGPDERETQYIDGFAWRIDGPVGLSWSASHRSLLDDPEHARRIADVINWGTQAAFGGPVEPPPIE